MKLAKDSLVLYKQVPARVRDVGEKLEILLPNGNTRSVREKDIVFLHPGPLATFPDLESNAPEGQPEEAWELLQGESPELKELAELVYGEYSPSTAWLAFKLLNRSPWFRGTPDAIEVVDAEKVAEYLRAEQEKQNAEHKWQDFIERFRHKDIHPEEDEIFLRDLEIHALSRSKGSRILKTLGKTQSPENAHRVMLEYGVKPETWNPHPLRLNVPLNVPDYFLGNLPPEDRWDLTHLESFAIDDEDSQDPDDALAWDGERFWVHVADAAALFPPGSPEDEAARERASSLYLPEKIVPMLPPEAAKRLGLGLAKTSPAMSYAFTVDDNFQITGFSIHLSTVRVTRLTYLQADKRLQDEPFAIMKCITDNFAAKRIAAGSISIRMPEVKISVSDSGEVSIISLPELASRAMVAESMLIAGHYAAEFCRERSIPIPFAVQDKPDGADENADNKTAEQFPKDYAVEFNRRRGMKRSRSTLECGAHSGLGLSAYSRVTSPLRRYPDLIASRQIRQHILGKELEDADAVLAGLAAFETRVGSLIQAERRSNFFWKLLWLKRHPGYTAEAWLVDRREKQGLFLIPELALEIWASLKKDIPPGTRTVLKLKEVDLAESSALFIVQKA
ncbi:MAG: hypothetical protein B0D92_01780 [Spirochaeta sp. LUC14_002_19_P3]|nr:MAG: hypothetical protein B0D92_01780 [Spirochaeta sp. LUC14_002_19_P3]